MIVKSVQQLRKDNSHKRLSPLQAIKLHCKIECAVQDMESWKNCNITDCFLWRYRLGKGNRSLNQKQASRVDNFNKKPHQENPSDVRETLK